MFAFILAVSLSQPVYTLPETVIESTPPKPRKELVCGQWEGLKSSSTVEVKRCEWVTR